MEAVVEIVGVNGDTVVVAGPDAGRDGIWLATELDGFMDPVSEAVTKEFGNRPGSRFVSNRILARTIVFNITIENDEDDGWRERDARWRRLWSYNDYTGIRVSVAGESRTLSARLEEIEVDTTHDPHVNGATDITMTVVADDPFWYGPDFVQEFEVLDEQTFSVENLNPTSNPVFPVWVLEGGTSWYIPSQVPGGRSVWVPPMGPGDYLVVNTDPGTRQVTASTGALVWGEMNGVRFTEPIPPYTGSGEVELQSWGDYHQPYKAQLRIRRPYSRPWGDV